MEQRLASNEPNLQSLLPVYSSGRKQIWSHDYDLDSQLGRLLENEMLWVIRPSLGKLYRSDHSNSPAAARVQSLLRGDISPARAASSAWRYFRRSPATWACNGAIVDGHLRLWRSENQARALFGSSLAPKSAFPIRAHISPQLLASDEVVGLANEVSIQSGIPADRIALSLAGAIAFTRTLGDMIEKTQPSTIISASQQHAFCRSSVLIGRALGLPTVYIPHAPTAINRIYADIPHDIALLRGARDRSYYVELGGRPEGLEVLGIPSELSLQRTVSDDSPIVVFATSADRTRQSLSSALQLIVDSGVTDMVGVLVAPHPRDHSVALRAARRFELRVASASTAEVLRSKNVVALVSERASGAMMEALQIGIPVARMGANPNYVFEDAFAVASVARSSDLRNFVQTVLQGTRQGPNPTTVAEFIHDSGPAVVERINTRLGDLIKIGCSVLDSWRPVRKAVP